MYNLPPYETMNPDTSSHPTGPNGVPSQIVIWWIIWFGILSALVTVYLVLGRREALVTENPLLGLVALGPLVMSAAVRWLVLPRVRDVRRALPVFVMGLALAEGCGILGIFLGGPHRESLFLLGVLGVGQFVPVFARKQFSPDHGLRGPG